MAAYDRASFVFALHALRPARDAARPRSCPTWVVAETRARVGRWLDKAGLQ